MIYDFLLNAAADIAKKRSESGFSPNPDDTICTIYTNIGSIYSGVSSVNANGVIHAEIDAVNSMRSHGESIIQAIAVLNLYTLSPILPCNGCINYIISVNSENAKCMIVIPNGNIRITEVGMFIASMNQRRTIQPVNQNMRYVSNTPNYTYATNQTGNGNIPVQPRVNMSSGYPSGYSQMPNNPQTYTSGQPVMNTQQIQTQPAMNTPQITPQTSVNPQPTSSIFSPDASKKAGGDYLKNKVNNLLGDDDESLEEEKGKKKNKKLFGGIFNS